MIDSSTKKNGPRFHGDADGTDAQINRKLTEHLRKHAIKVTAGNAPAEQEASKGMSTTLSSPLSAIRFLGTAIAQIIGLVAIIVLMAIASVHAHFYEKKS
ncbi:MULTISPECIES: hypothetical protein [unclassified Rhizobium]|uniref:hypothetical protein n=1 Tax=unclassified Rhizobium TaxID=2613769 RepID=UPI0007163120|nr:MULTISPECIES: hypothetical protein [unclassified Rhizobium]KQS83046.1 hypothetical protein ASG50_11595 [Rhizobium sp. Leaf386]KQS89069.1 hypothetical protein ASG42_15035 [Rhizobium sp. Leaf391]KQT92917.1 hypothetical protein ASG68_16225 [Rhizobium sp. Leaf453]